jgi:hypothetical protein
MKILITGLCLLSMSCSYLQPKPVEVRVPIAQPCLVSRPAIPFLKFDSLPRAKTDLESAEQVRVLWNDRQTLLNTLLEWQTAAAGCQVVK